ncbi:MAG: hypothetical protein EPO21_16885 [Chloroflexota bacterium]|nr:MAG: hypothetical protein EPO21_16885 [Chloroflexota bacterium]
MSARANVARLGQGLAGGVDLSAGQRSFGLPQHVRGVKCGSSLTRLILMLFCGLSSLSHVVIFSKHRWVYYSVQVTVQPN